jgi:glycine cleavage system aminomethyltransferase T
MTIEENPYDVGYGYKWMVELEQEQDFIGREALREVATRGVSRSRARGAAARRLQRRLNARFLPRH